MEQKLKTIHALLFTYGEPLSLEKLARFAEIPKQEVGECIERLNTALMDTPFTVLSHENSFQLATRPEYASALEAALKSEVSEELTPASLETLAIIAYLGPVLRAKVDYIRGVNSSFILRNLLLRGLISRVPDPQRANTYVYSVSFDFLRHLGVRELSELPEFERYRKFLDGVRIAVSE
jgi:segregation and condensation protein B